MHDQLLQLVHMYLKKRSFVLEFAIFGPVFVVFYHRFVKWIPKEQVYCSD